MDEQERRRRIAASRAGRRAAADGDPSAWFDPLYAAAREADDPESVPWIRLAPNPILLEWLPSAPPAGRAVVVGCGLGDDAEALAARGLQVTAFDVAPSAVDWCRRRFPDSDVDYVTADLFAPPPAWVGGFDLVVEIKNVQALPLAVRAEAATAVARLVAPGGVLLSVAQARPEHEIDPKGPPWPLTAAEMAGFAVDGLAEQALDSLPAATSPDRRYWRGVYRRSVS